MIYNLQAISLNMTRSILYIETLLSTDENDVSSVNTGVSFSNDIFLTSKPSLIPKCCEKENGDGVGDLLR